MTEQPEHVDTIESTSDDRLWSLLAYLFSPVIPIVLLLLEDKKSRPYIKYHNMHALALGVSLTIINIVLSFVIIGICTTVLSIGLLIYYGIKAYQGEVFEIPFVTDFLKKQGWI
jgi:uncharacterized membrane protein